MLTTRNTDLPSGNRRIPEPSDPVLVSQSTAMTLVPHPPASRSGRHRRTDPGWPQAPSFALVGRTTEVQVYFTNLGTHDIASPVINVTTDPSVTLTTLDEDAPALSGSYEAVAISHDGPAGIIRPGQVGVISLRGIRSYIKETVDFNASRIVDDGTTVDYTSFIEGLGGVQDLRLLMGNRDLSSTPGRLWDDLDELPGWAWITRVTQLSLGGQYTESVALLLEDTGALSNSRCITAPGIERFRQGSTTRQSSSPAPPQPVTFGPDGGGGLLTLEEDALYALAVALYGSVRRHGVSVFLSTYLNPTGPNPSSNISGLHFSDPFRMCPMAAQELPGKCELQVLKTMPLLLRRI